MVEHNTCRIALLALSDESVFYGYSKGYNGETGEDDNIHCVGEVVFNTSISGYQEILTDPSYHSQIINFTYPHIGNVGVNVLDEEADNIATSGIVARSITARHSNWRASEALPDYLKRRKIIALDGVDTRAITRRLRDNGALGGCLMVVGEGNDVQAAARQAIQAARAFAGLDGAMLAAAASCKQQQPWTDGEWQQSSNAYTHDDNKQRRVTVLDCGVKRNIMRALSERGCQVSLLPYDSDYAAIKNSKPDGVLISNGPGDPLPCTNACNIAKQLIADNIPLFGLCLGHQIVATALGAQSKKMKFGHHGANHPVQESDSGRVLITSQNHGFAVDPATLPDNITITHRSLFDGTLQGFAADTPPLITFQGHPEASPGPTDAAILFDQFMRLIDKKKVTADA